MPIKLPTGGMDVLDIFQNLWTEADVRSNNYWKISHGMKKT